MASDPSPAAASLQAMDFWFVFSEQEPAGAKVGLSLGGIELYGAGQRDSSQGKCLYLNLRREWIARLSGYGGAWGGACRACVIR